MTNFFVGVLVNLSLTIVRIGILERHRERALCRNLTRNALYSITVGFISKSITVVMKWDVKLIVPTTDTVSLANLSVKNGKVNDEESFLRFLIDRTFFFL